MSVRNKYLAFLTVLLIALFTSGCEPGQAVTGPAAAPAQQEKQSSQPSTAETMAVTVYYATKDATFLVPEIRTVSKTDHPAQAAVEQLLLAPKNADLVQTLPEGTKLKGITVKNHVAYVDFNDKLIKNGRGGSTGEILVVGAIVNTVTEFADIYKVQIMVEGKKVGTLYGHLDVSEPLSRSESIIKKSL
jgi:germination protein M